MRTTRFVLPALLALALALVALLPVSEARAGRPAIFEAVLAGPEGPPQRTPGHYIVIQRSTGHYLDPEASTDATGEARLMFLGPGLHYQVRVNDLEGATEVSLHLLTDLNGEVYNDVVATLWKGTPSRGSFTGRLAGGWLNDRDIFGPLQGEGLSGLQREMDAGNVYVVVHTERYPKGEIGGPALTVTAP